jgi:hypothetical protein
MNNAYTILVEAGGEEKLCRYFDSTADGLLPLTVEIAKQFIDIMGEGVIKEEEKETSVWNDPYTCVMTAKVVELMHSSLFVPELVFSQELSEMNDSMDGDHASALASAGCGTDEDYGG